MPDRSRQLLGPLLDGDRQAARAVLDQAFVDGGPRDRVYTQSIVPCLRQIGELWQRGELTVPDEHLATETLTSTLHEFQAPQIRDPRAPTAVVSCVPGERHVLPAFLASDVLTSLGWRIWFLGQAPLEQLVEFVGLHHPRLLVLSVTLAENLPGVAAVGRGLVDHRKGLTIAAGGAGVAGVADPADISVDVIGRDVVDLARIAVRLRSDSAPAFQTCLPIPPREDS